MKALFRLNPILPYHPPDGYLVGGAVRDLLLGRHPVDYDFLVPDPAEAAKAASEVLKATIVPLKQGVMRVRRGELTLDFAPLPSGGLAEELERRDFTVNALAMNPKGAVFGLPTSRADLRRRRLRAVRRVNLLDDPVRALRAVRLWTTHGLRPEPLTWDWIREVAERIRFYPPPFERTSEELRKILMHPRAAFGVSKLKESGLLEALLRELAAGIGIEQGGYHHLDVFGHQLEALAELVRRFPQSPLELRFATLVHDVAKPLVRQWDPERGYWRFFFHDEDGAGIARAMARRLKFNKQAARKIEAWVAAHMRRPPKTEAAFQRWLFRHRALLPELLMLQIADVAASRGPKSRPEEVEHLEARLKEARARLSQAPQTPRLGGRELLALTGRPPGPWIETLKALLLEAEWRGEVSSYEEAKDFVKSWHETQASPDRSPPHG